MDIEQTEAVEHGNRLETRVDEVFQLSLTSQKRNELFARKIVDFIRILKKDHPGVSLKNIPAVEKLRSGSERAESMDADLRREIESELESFLDRVEQELAAV